MSFRRLFLVAVLYSTIWLVGDSFLVDSMTQNGSKSAFGLDRDHLILIDRLLGGFSWAFVYWALVNSSKRRATPDPPA